MRCRKLPPGGDGAARADSAGQLASRIGSLVVGGFVAGARGAADCAAFARWQCDVADRAGAGDGRAGARSGSAGGGASAGAAIAGALTRSGQPTPAVPQPALPPQEPPAPRPRSRQPPPEAPTGTGADPAAAAGGAAPAADAAATAGAEPPQPPPTEALPAPTELPLPPPPAPEPPPLPARRSPPPRAVAVPPRTTRPAPAGPAPPEAPQTQTAPTGGTASAASAPPAPHRTGLAECARGLAWRPTRPIPRRPGGAATRAARPCVSPSNAMARSLAVQLVSGTGSAILDDAVERMLRGARLPAFPPGMEQAEVTVTVQIRYRLE